MGWSEAVALALIWLNLGMLVLLDGYLAEWVALDICALNLVVEAAERLEGDDPQAFLRIATQAAEITVTRDALCLLHERMVAPLSWRTLCAVLAGPVIPAVTLARAVRLKVRSLRAAKRIAVLLGGA